MITSNLINKFNKPESLHHHNTRHKSKFCIPLIQYDPARRSILYHGPKMWSSLSESVRQSKSVKSFLQSFRKTTIMCY